MYNYLQNKLPIKSKSYKKLVSEKDWINQKQNLSYIYIFSSLVLINISYKKQLKSDFWKTWESILIGYSLDIYKHFHI